MVRVEADFFKYKEKGLRFRKYLDTCGRGLRVTTSLKLCAFQFHYHLQAVAKTFNTIQLLKD